MCPVQRCRRHHTFHRLLCWWWRAIVSPSVEVLTSSLSTNTDFCSAVQCSTEYSTKYSTERIAWFTFHSICLSSGPSLLSGMWNKTETKLKQIFFYFSRPPTTLFYFRFVSAPRTCETERWNNHRRHGLKQLWNKSKTFQSCFKCFISVSFHVWERPYSRYFIIVIVIFYFNNHNSNSMNIS